jgi:cell division protein ZapA (FtsZ GTPase activity inhibitor)
MAALNIAHELLLLQKGHTQGEHELAQRLHGLQQRVGEALAAQPHLDASPETV